jgi:hypothetical protein
MATSNPPAISTILTDVIEASGAWLFNRKPYGEKKLADVES